MAPRIQRIQNFPILTSQGNIKGREATLAILEAGLQACDPYENICRLVRIEGDRLIIGNRDFEPQNSPISGDEVISLSEINNIYVIGAAKGVQRMAKALEDILGERLSGGHVVDKKGSPVILNKIGVTLGAHPVPDEDCVAGCRKILALTEKLTADDLVFTCAGSGISSLLTMPVPGVSLEDIQKTTYIMQVEHGATTTDLNPVRNHLDVMKGGKISGYINPARAIHLIADDPNDYQKLMYQNFYLHTLPDSTSYQEAVTNLKNWGAWDAIPDTVRRFLEKADPRYETVKAAQFEKTPFRIFGLMPGFKKTTKFPPAMKKAAEMGYKPIILSDDLFNVEASQAGQFAAAVARTIERAGQPAAPPCALFGSGEMVVTVGKETGIGGRNQEFVLSAAQGISGSKNIVIASVDTDGTDGPGSQFVADSQGVPCLAGGIVDGDTVVAARKAGINISEEIRRHNSTPALLQLGGGIIATQSIGLLDFTIILIMNGSGS